MDISSLKNQNKLIFYVLPQQKVKLYQVKSNKLFTDQIQQDLSTQATINALKYRFPLKYLGKQHQQIVVLCIPAKQPKIINLNNKQKNKQQQTIPNFIKVPNDFLFQSSQNIGYASGKRSAIVPYKNKFLRYKGCGNLVQGFFVQNNQLRGCHFYHTAKRQLYMTAKINQILMKQIGITSANIPLCMFEYQNEQIIKINLKSDLSLLGKYCCIFQTIGDRRLGTHIISPLQILFLNIFKVDKINWMEIFQSKNRLQQNQPIQFLPYWLFLQPGQQFLTELFKIELNNNYIQLNQVQLQNVDVQKIEQFIEKVLDKLVKNENQKSLVKIIFKKLIKTKNLQKIFQIILKKIGYQMGQIKRIFCDHSINWGYFNDHGNLWHCNAHLNNFVSTFPNKNSQFLLPLDYDLSFTRQQYIRIDLDQECQQKFGKFDNDQFQNFLCSQYQAMQMSVSGMQVMNFKYAIDYDRQKQLSPTSPIKMSRISFRDTLIKSFRQGMRRQKSIKEEINNLWNQNIEKIQQIIQVCLIISQDFQT